MIPLISPFSMVRFRLLSAARPPKYHAQCLHFKNWHEFRFLLNSVKRYGFVYPETTATASICRRALNAYQTQSHSVSVADRMFGLLQIYRTALESRLSSPPGIKSKTRIMERPKNAGLICISGRESSNRVYITDTPITGPRRYWCRRPPPR
jgi:hypothetical protein